MQIVIDKSFLRSSPKSLVHDICQNHQVLFVSNLLFELMDSDDRAECSAKLPSRVNSVLFMQEVPELLNYEKHKRHAAHPIMKFRIHKHVSLNEKLCSKNFDFSRYNHDNAECKRVVQDEVSRLKVLSLSIFNFWPGLKNHNGRIPDEKILEIRREVASEQDIVKALWHIIRPEGFPPADMIGPEWVIYRWTQLRVLLCLDWVRRHIKLGEANNVKLEHDLHDLYYVLFAALAGGLATSDIKQRETFRLVRPDGHIYNASG